MKLKIGVEHRIKKYFDIEIKGAKTFDDVVQWRLRENRFECTLIGQPDKWVSVHLPYVDQTEIDSKILPDILDVKND